MFCVYCDHENRPERNFCAQCGASLVAACTQCNFRNQEGEDYCGGCGSWIRPGKQARQFTLNTDLNEKDLNEKERDTTDHNSAQNPAPIDKKLSDKTTSNESGAIANSPPASPSPASTSPSPGPSGDQPDVAPTKTARLSEPRPDSLAREVESTSINFDRNYTPVRNVFELNPRPTSKVFEDPAIDTRQLPVALHCDLVTGAAFDPQQRRLLLRNFQRAAAQVIERHDGYVSEITSENIVAYFGYPKIERNADASRSNDIDARTAAKAGVGAAFSLISTIDGLNESVNDVTSDPLAIRVAVTVETTAVLGTAIVAMAEPGEVVIDDANHRLLAAELKCESLDSKKITTSGEPMMVWRVLKDVKRLSSTTEPETIPETVEESRIVGRDRELTVLKRAWSEVSRGAGQVVLIRGDSGHGKSRLSREVAKIAGTSTETTDKTVPDPVARQDVGRHDVGRHDVRRHDVGLHLALHCQPVHINSPLFPFLDRLRQYSTQSDEGQHKTRLAECFKDTVNRDSISHTLEDIVSPTAQSTVRRDQQLEALQLLIEKLANDSPLIITVDDIQWIDQTSLDLLAKIIESVPSRQILLIISSRKEFPVAWNSFDHVQQIHLGPIDSVAAGRLISNVADDVTLSLEQRKRILDRSDCVPLFLEELTRAVCRQSHLGHEPASVPENLRESLAARLGEPCLSREIALVASVLGREFNIQMVAALTDYPESDVRRAINELITTGIVRPVPFVSDQFQFHHALVQESAYESLLRTRRIELHRIAARLSLKNKHRDTSNYCIVAWHLDRAGDDLLATENWEQAALHAFRCATFSEMMAHAHKALEGIGRCPASHEKQCREARLMVLLGASHQASSGLTSPDTLEAFATAHALALETGEADIRMDALRGLFTSHCSRGELHLALELAEQTRDSVEKGTLNHGEEFATYLEGVTHFWRGDFVEARKAFERAHATLDALASDDTSKLLSGNADLHSEVLGLLSWCDWITGEPASAAQTSALALECLRDCKQPINTVMTQFCLAATAICTGSNQEADNIVKDARAIAESNGFVYLDAALTVMHGQVSILSDEMEEGLLQVSRGIEKLNACEAGIGYPWILSMAASSYLRAGHIDAANDTAIEAIRRTEMHGERHWVADLYRIKGQICVQLDEHDEARRWFNRAYETAGTQGARALELRTLVDISQLREVSDPTLSHGTVLDVSLSNDEPVERQQS